MSFISRRNPWEAELTKLQNQENRWIDKRREKKETRLNHFLETKVPERLQDTLDAAFAKAFGLVFEKGTDVIEKTYRKGEKEKEFQINQYAAGTRENKQSVRQFSKEAKNTGRKHVALSGVSGIGLGALGIGIPDIPVFTAMMLRNIYEMALAYGFSYDTKEERYFILLLIQGAVSYGEELIDINKKMNAFMEKPSLPSGYSQEVMVEETARHLSRELLYMKFLQGIPVAGAIGGAYDVIYMKNVTDYGKLKYGQRFYKNELAKRGKA